MKKLTKDQTVYIRAKVSGGDLQMRPRVIPIDDVGQEHEEGSIAVRRNFIVEKKKPAKIATNFNKCGVCQAPAMFMDLQSPHGAGYWCLEHALAHATGLKAMRTKPAGPQLGWAYVCRGEAHMLHVCYLIGFNEGTSVFSYVTPNQWAGRSEPDDRAKWTGVERCAKNMVTASLPTADEIKAIVDKIGLPPGYQEPQS